MTPDPRRGVPSASETPRLIHCPAAHEMCKHAPAEHDTKDADAGNVVHAILSDDLDADDAGHSAAQTAEMCEEQAEALLGAWQDQHEEYAGLECIQFSEVRYGLTEFASIVEVTPESKARIIFTGQFDRLYIQGERGLLIDFKALRGHHAQAVDNAQLMSLAVLVAKRHKLKSVRICLVQPWAGKPTVADLDEQALRTAEEWLGDLLLKVARSTPADRKSGPWCKFCKANSRCEVAWNESLAVAEPLNYMNIAGLDGDSQRKALFARAMELSPEKHVALYKGAAMLKRMHEVITGSFKQRVEAGEIPGYTLREKKGRRSISDVGTVFSRANEHGVTPEAFTAECSLPLGALNDLLRAATKAKGKALELIASQCLEGCVDTGKPSFEVVANNQLEEQE